MAIYEAYYPFDQLLASMMLNLCAEALSFYCQYVFSYFICLWSIQWRVTLYLSIVPCTGESEDNYKFIQNWTKYYCSGIGVHDHLCRKQSNIGDLASWFGSVVIQYITFITYIKTGLNEPLNKLTNTYCVHWTICDRFSRISHGRRHLELFWQLTRYGGNARR